MKRKFTLTSRDMSSIMINLIAVKMLFTYPRFLIERCENSAWIPILVYGAAAFGIYYITQWLYTKTGRTSILSQAEAIGGRWLKIIIGFILIAVLFVDISPMIRACPEAIKTALLQNSSMTLIVFMLVIGIIMGTYNGIEALGKAAALFLPVAGIFMLGFFLMVMPSFEINNLFPVSFTNSIMHGTSALSVFSDIIVINILLPYCKDSSTVKKAGLSSIVISGAVGVLITISYCLVYPYPVSARFIVPMYQLSRMVNIGTFFQRLEAAFEFVWTISSLFYASVYLFILCEIFKECFDLKNYRPLIFPMVTILISFVFRRETYSDTLSDAFVNMSVIYPILYILPLIIGLAYMIKMNKNERRVQ